MSALHRDSAMNYFKGWQISSYPTQFSALVCFQMPESGGELTVYKKRWQPQDDLAKEAAHLEINLLNRPIGKQDHYAAAYGGINIIKFFNNEDVIVEPIAMSNKRKQELFNNLFLFYTDITRDSSSVLEEQKKQTKNKMVFLNDMRDQVPKLAKIIENDNVKLNKFGLILDEGWQKKKELSSNISNDFINQYYDLAISAGCSGGKICGAGGGGFLLVYCDKNNSKIRKEFKELKELIFDYDNTGTEIIFSD